jgi:putative IMPACT (imprinted ancient) family translation regulator
MPRRQVNHQRSARKAIESQDRKLAKWNSFKLEYDNLKAERAKLREEITELDSKVANRDISKKQHAKEFRMRLTKAGEISRRMVEVIGEMAKLGKIPEDRPS